MKRVGLLGGAFNPPHAGHLRLAALAHGHLGLDEVRFIPTAISPHKPGGGASPESRMALVRAALEGVDLPFFADDLELERGGVSYTVDTLARLHEREPGIAWIWLMGTDQLPGIGRWKDLPGILNLASLGVALRPGWPLDVPEELADRVDPVWDGRPGLLVPLPGTESNLASRELRQLLEEGRDPEGLPIQVRAAIRRESLYRGSSKQEHE